MIVECVCIGDVCIDGELFGIDELKVKVVVLSFFFELIIFLGWCLVIDVLIGCFLLGIKFIVDLL